MALISALLVGAVCFNILWTVLAQSAEGNGRMGGESTYSSSSPLVAGDRDFHCRSVLCFVLLCLFPRPVRMNGTEAAVTGTSDRLDVAARRLMDLIGAAAPGLGCSFQLAPLPPGGAAAEGITLLLRRLAPLGRLRDASAALVLRADFLLSVSTADPMAGLRALGEIALSAMAEPDYEVASPEAPDIGLLISMRILRPREMPAARLVRGPLQVRIEPARALRGVLVNDAGSPLPRVPVTLRGSNESTSTDSEGKFLIAAPGEGPAGVEAEINGARRPAVGSAESRLFVTKSEG